MEKFLIKSHCQSLDLDLGIILWSRYKYVSSGPNRGSQVSSENLFTQNSRECSSNQAIWVNSKGAMFLRPVALDTPKTRLDWSFFCSRL